MRQLTNTVVVAGTSAMMILAYTPQAYAYLDPGTGSMILQGIIGAIAGGLVVGRMYWEKIKTFFGSQSSSKSEQETPRAADS